MDHEDQDSYKESWSIKLLQRKRPSKSQLIPQQALDRYMFLNYSVESLNGVPLIPEVFDKSKLLSVEDFPGTPLADFKKLEPKNPKRKLKKLLSHCDILYNNLVLGGFDTCSDALLYAVSIQFKNYPFVMCARKTYDRSYYYLIPILRHTFHNMTKRPSRCQSLSKPKSGWSMLHCIKSKKEPAKPEILIMCPSDTIQFILNRTRRLCDKSDLVVAAIKQANDPIPRNASILIADPMVLNCENKNLTLVNLRFCVLDECDVFFRGVYSEKLNSLISYIKNLELKCQINVILGFLSKKAIRFIDKHIADYNALFCGSFPSITMGTRFKVVECEESEKPRLAADCIANHPGTQILLYLNDPGVKADLTHEMNLESKFGHERPHMGRTTRILILKDTMTCEEKEKVISEFRILSDAILILNDEAAEELEFKDVPIIINYDLPLNISLFEFRHSCIGRMPTLPPFYSFQEKSDEAFQSVKNELLRDWLSKEGFNKPSATSYCFYNSKNYMLANDLVRLLTECQEYVPSFLSATEYEDSISSHRSLSRVNTINSKVQNSNRYFDGFSSRTSILETCLPPSSEILLKLPDIQEDNDELLSASILEKQFETTSYTIESPAVVDYDTV